MVGADAGAVSGREGGAEGGGGHASNPTVGTVGALAGGMCKTAFAGQVGAGWTQPTRMIDHGEQVDSQPHGAMQRIHAP